MPKGKSFKDLTADEKRLNNIKAEIAEDLVRYHFKKQGYKVVKTQIKAKDGYYKVLNREKILTLKQGDKLIDDFTDVINILSKYDKKIKLPDLICEKENEIVIVEVKSSKVDIEKVRQKKTLEVLAHKGYKVLVYIVPISREDINKFDGKEHTIEVEPSYFECFPIKKE